MDRVANLPLAAQAVLGLGALFFAYAIVQQLTTARRRQAIAREKGCLPPPAYPQWDTVLGTDIFRENLGVLSRPTPSLTPRTGAFTKWESTRIR